MKKPDHKSYLAERWAKQETGYEEEEYERKQEEKNEFYTEYGRAMQMLAYMESIGATITMCSELDGTELKPVDDE